MPFLQAASQREAAVYALAKVLFAEIITVLFCTGNATLEQLKCSKSLRQIKGKNSALRSQKPEFIRSLLLVYSFPQMFS